jgi:hypothetical protein
MRPAAAAPSAFALAFLALAITADALTGQTTANFPANGPWNYNGTGAGINPRCLPLSDRLAELAKYDLAEQGAFYTALFQLVATGATGTVETPIAFHAFSYIKSAMFNTMTAFHETAVPLFPTGVERRPAAEATPENMNTAILFAILRVAEKVLPAGAVPVRAYMEGLGLDPANASTDPASPAGIGNLNGAAALERYAADGFNALGDAPGASAFPYADYTGFTPANTAYALTNKTAWQPLFETNGKGSFFAQTHITPQAGRVRSNLMPGEVVKAAAGAEASTPAPYGADFNASAYRAQAEAVVAASAALTEEKKLLAEYLDDKVIFEILDRANSGLIARYSRAASLPNTPQFASFAPMALAIAIQARARASLSGADSVFGLHLPCLSPPPSPLRPRSRAPTSSTGSRPTSTPSAWPTRSTSRGRRR